MSRIGKKLIQIPQDVEVEVHDSVLLVKGPKGQLQRSVIQAVDIHVEKPQADGPAFVSVVLKSDAAESFHLWGLTRALIANMIKGVSHGFEKTLEFSGVGYKAQVKGDGLELNLGFSHPIFVKATEGVTFKVEKNTITISGISNEAVGQMAAHIRTFRPPEPYQGSGIKYRGEIIRRKAGKKAASVST